MNQAQAKWTLIGGISAIVIAFIMEMANQATIAAEGTIILGILLIGGGFLAIAIATIWYLMNPIKRKS